MFGFTHGICTAKERGTYGSQFACSGKCWQYLLESRESKQWVGRSIPSTESREIKHTTRDCSGTATYRYPHRDPSQAFRKLRHRDGETHPQSFSRPLHGSSVCSRARRREPRWSPVAAWRTRHTQPKEIWAWDLTSVRPAMPVGSRYSESSVQKGI